MSRPELETCWGFGADQSSFCLGVSILFAEIFCICFPHTYAGVICHDSTLLSRHPYQSCFQTPQRAPALSQVPRRCFFRIWIFGFLSDRQRSRINKFAGTAAEQHDPVPFERNAGIRSAPSAKNPPGTAEYARENLVFSPDPCYTESVLFVSGACFFNKGPV